MKKMLVVGVVVLVCPLLAETTEEACARFSSYRSVWNTNALACVKLVAIGDAPAVAAAKSKWFAYVMALPDVTETNRIGDVLYAKRQFLQRNAGSRCIICDTNCWYAVADFIARLKCAADPKWRSADSKSPYDFSHYRRESLEAYMKQHTNRFSEATVRSAFSRDWKSMAIAKWNREVELEKAENKAKQIIKKSFWRFGAKDLPADVKAVCRSNIVERAHLTPEEEHDIFEDVPDWYYRVMGIERKQ